MIMFSQVFLGLSSLCCNLLIIILYIVTHNWGFISSTAIQLATGFLGLMHKLFLLVAVPLNEFFRILVDIDLLTGYFKYLTFSAISGVLCLVLMMLLFGFINPIALVSSGIFGAVVAAVDTYNPPEVGFEIGERLE